jgi:hypothetical protein
LSVELVGGEEMKQTLRKLEKDAKEYRYDGQLDDIRELIAEYRDEQSKSLWQRIKRWFKPHVELKEVDSYSQIKLLLLSTPENKQVDLVNDIVRTVPMHFLHHYIEVETCDLIQDVIENQSFISQLDNPHVEARIGGDR